MNSKFSKTMSLLQDPLFLFIRLFWGFKIMRAGLLKLNNLEATADQFFAMGVKMPLIIALVVGSIEAFGGVSILIGVATRLWASLIALIMASAYLFEHPETLALFNSLPLMEALDGFMKPYHFLYLFPMIILMACGPGRCSFEWLWFSLQKIKAKKVVAE